MAGKGGETLCQAFKYMSNMGAVYTILGRMSSQIEQNKILEARVLWMLKK